MFLVSNGPHAGSNLKVSCIGSHLTHTDIETGSTYFKTVEKTFLSKTSLWIAVIYIIHHLFSLMQQIYVRSLQCRELGHSAIYTVVVPSSTWF